MVSLHIGIPAKIKNINQTVVSKNIFAKQVCQDFINARKQTDPKSGTLPDKEKSHFKYVDLKFLNHKVVEILKAIVVSVNSFSYNFDITEINAGYILKNEPDNYSDWYVDLGEDELTTTRKLTALVFLTDAKDYQGGGLSLLTANSGVIYDQGTVVVIPAYQLYKFEPVTRGSNQVFIYWACGPAFH